MHKETIKQEESMKFLFILTLFFTITGIVFTHNSYAFTEIEQIRTSSVYNSKTVEDFTFNLNSIGFIGNSFAASPSSPSSCMDAVIVNCKEIQLSWTTGNGQGRLIVASKENPVNAFPINGNSYKASSIFGKGEDLGKGNFVVYKGSGNNTTLSIEEESTYYFSIFEYNEHEKKLLYLSHEYPSKKIIMDQVFVENTMESELFACNESQLVLDAGEGYFSYKWSNGSENQKTTIDSPVDFEQSFYSVTVFNENGCSKSIPVKIAYMNCDKVNGNTSDTDFEVYPNPVNRILTLRMKDSPTNNYKSNLNDEIELKTSVRVIDLLGNIKYYESLSFYAQSKNIYLGNLEQGIYLLQIENKEKVETRKIIIRR